MKVLFLTLLLGVVCAAQEEEAEQNLSEASGQWRTVYIGSTDPEKIQENGPFRTYFRKLVFDDEKGTVDFYFYVKRNGKWKNVHVRGTKQEDGTYAVDYEGQNAFKVISMSKTHLVAHDINVDKHGKKTELTGLFVKLNVEDEDLEKFRKLTEDKGIDKKNVVNFIENGNKSMYLISISP
ncbi:odorant-binding protein-like [Oryx dammah]|uniref:odorant-binding protein-like n=1 Tax=Oryx dammah TaxID=59534 RepID=UPI001A9A7660|nr:odorant-binding protein-like [Oryx dammah]